MARSFFFVHKKLGYYKHWIRLHDKFEDAAENVQDAEVKAFALKTLPVLKTHLDSATVINDDIKKMKK